MVVSPQMVPMVSNVRDTSKSFLICLESILLVCGGSCVCPLTLAIDTSWKSRKWGSWGREGGAWGDWRGNGPSTDSIFCPPPLHTSMCTQVFPWCAHNIIRAVDTNTRKQIFIVHTRNTWVVAIIATHWSILSCRFPSCNALSLNKRVVAIDAMEFPAHCFKSSKVLKTALEHRKCTNQWSKGPSCCRATSQSAHYCLWTREM